MKMARIRRVAATIATTIMIADSEGGIISEVVLVESDSKLVDTVLVVSEPISAMQNYDSKITTVELI
jgi:hypothetical protein